MEAAQCGDYHHRRSPYDTEKAEGGRENVSRAFQKAREGLTGVRRARARLATESVGGIFFCISAGDECCQLSTLDRDRRDTLA